jgi:hypothetical protein
MGVGSGAVRSRTQRPVVSAIVRDAPMCGFLGCGARALVVINNHAACVMHFGDALREFTEPLVGAMHVVASLPPGAVALPRLTLDVTTPTSDERA